MEDTKNHIRQVSNLTRQDREQFMDQQALTIWLTGLSGAGKSTIANGLEHRLAEQGMHTMVLDGDNIRKGLNRGLGFSEEDRSENIRRVAEVAKLMNDAGLIVIASLISPFQMDRDMARSIIGDAFVEVYVATPLEECERRDVKGLYQKARKGEIAEFTGITSPYEPPEHPEIRIDTTGRRVEDTIDDIMGYLLDHSGTAGTEKRRI